MSQLIYELLPSLKAKLVEKEQQIDKVVIIRLLADCQNRFSVLVNLNEIKDLLDQKFLARLRSIDDLKKFVRLFVRWLSQILSLPLELEDLIVKPQLTAEYCLQLIRGKQVFSLVYLQETDSEIIEELLTSLHQDFMLKYSCAFNQQLKFPIILATATIKYSELKDLKCGNIIFFDSIKLPNVELKCHLTNLYIDVELEPNHSIN